VEPVTGAFVPWVKKLNPKVEIVHQAWPKLGEKDYTPFINVILASKPEAVFSTLWGGHFITFAKQARDYFEKFAFVSAGEAGCLEAIKGAGDDMPLGIISNAYDTFYFPDTAWHKDWIARLSAYTGEKYPTSWATIDSSAGKLTMRAKDHQTNRGQYWGTVSKVGDYPFPILQPIKYIEATGLME
jgi:branched-chain amino acid transport system substrate-binding protein